MVEFERLGPGQVGRLVYQVIGTNGPIPNPKKIVYLAPEVAEIAKTASTFVASGSVGGAMALSALTVGALAGVIALQASTLHEVRKLNQKLDKVLERVGDIQTRLDSMAFDLKRIEAGVAQNNFRHALKHIVSVSWCGAELDLIKLSGVIDEIESFWSELNVEEPCGALPGLHLSADVRDQLDNVWSLLRNTRLLMFQRHNIKVNGEPLSVASSDVIKDYIPTASNLTELVFMISCMDISVDVGRMVYNMFTFANYDDSERVERRISNGMVSSAMPYFKNPFNESLFDVFLNEAGDGACLDDFTRLEDNLKVFPSWWLMCTDAGLLFRVWDEAMAVREGYHSRYGHMILGEVISEVEDADLGVFEETFVFDFEEVDSLSSVAKSQVV